MTHKIYYFLLLYFLSSGASFSSEPSPLVHVVSNYGSKYIYIMNEAAGAEDSSGACYKISDNHEFELKWRTKNFYSYPMQLALSSDGSFLARALKIPSKSVKNSDPAI